MTPPPERIRVVGGEQTALRHLCAAFEFAPLPMALVGPDDRVRYANPAMGRLAGYQASELAGLTLAALTHPDERDQAAAGRRAVARGTVAVSTVDARLVRPDGGTVWASISCSPVGEVGDGPALVVQMVDITEHKHAEQSLARSNSELGSFAYLAAHELKSPLQAMSGFAALLDRAYGPRLESGARECVTWIADGANRMGALIEDLLAYCSVDIDEPLLEPVVLDQVVADVVGRLDREVTRAGAVVTVDPLPRVTGDHVALGQLVGNLVANALKFVPEGRQPRVHVSAERSGDGWTVTVSDNGIGVEESARDRIFAMFQRLHPRERYEGTGIGLSICKRIVERRGGTIWVEPDPGGGSRFRFRIPDVLSPAASSSAA
jgi:PAS domain S-box-containing protein